MLARLAPTMLACTGTLSLCLLCGAAWATPEGLEADTPGVVGMEVQRTEGTRDTPATEPAPDQAADSAEPALKPASRLLVNAMNFLGVAYRRGGSSEISGFDCSGFTRYIVQTTFGYVLPRRANEQASAAGLRKVNRQELQPGDLVFFNTRKGTFSHVGIYMGDDKFIHSPRAGGRVRIEDMGYAYWRKRFTGARRLGALVKAAGEAAAMPLLNALP
jgi:cell wall-associated NlpC family hydrolase